MADLTYFLVAESVAVDQTTNRVSVFHLLEEVGFAAFPGQLSQLVAVSCWKDRPGNEVARLPLRLQVRYPEGLSSPPPIETTLEPGDTLGRRAFVTLTAVEFPQAGEYAFELYEGEEKRGLWVVTVFLSADAV